MKKRISKMLVLMTTMTMILGSALTVHAEGYGYKDGVYWSDDGCYHGDGTPSAGELGLDTIELLPIEEGYIEDVDPGDSGDFVEISDPVYEAPASDGSYDVSSEFNSESHSESRSSSGTSDSGEGPAPAPVIKAAGKVVAVEGGQKFRAVAKESAGTYTVVHCGNTVAVFTLKDADGNARACTSVALKKLESGKWAVNYTVDDADGLSIGSTADCTYMYRTLGVSFVTINDIVSIDMEAESAALTE